MAGASDPLEDMLFSEVDEKAVSDLVGSLESQLTGQSNSAGKADENGGAGSVAPANHHLGKTLPAPVSTTTLEQQQQPERRNKPEMHQEVNSKDASPDKTVTSASLSCSSSFGEPTSTSAGCVNATSSGIQSHGASITPLTASGVSTLASPQDSISTTSSRSAKVSQCTGEAPAEASAQRKRVATPRRSPSARIKSLNGAAVTTRRSSITAVTDSSIISSVDPGATPPNSTRSAINTSTFTLSNANLPVGQSAIALDRGTPTIALHRLPSHIVASIAQNGNGTSVSALVQQGARIEPATSSSPTGDLSKAATDTGASKTDDCQSNIVTQSQVGSVSSVINTVLPSASCAITPATATTAAPTTTTTVTQPLSSATTAVCATAMATTSVCGTVQTTAVTSTMSMVRPTAPSPTPAVATPALSQPRPGVPTPQRIVAPQLIVRPSQQQTTIQLPPGFTIPQGKVLFWRVGENVLFFFFLVCSVFSDFLRIGTKQ
ncbi:cell wall protein DAN4-like, partial [Poecilia reticulata]|uniref:cell wall protein DAN4-like n=1 Tax=Poecilia reticulata TaxID=8081 RepID=UPI0007E9334A